MEQHKLVVIDHLTKRYAGSKVDAVSDLSLSIAAGQVYGFLGSNGAGKSTTIRLMMSFIKPSHGIIRILGDDSQAQTVAIHKDIGYVAGDVALPKNVTGKQLLQYLSNLHGSVDKAYTRLLIDRFSVDLDKKIGELSKGNRQKVGLLQAFMHKPKVLILDEPTSGLDPLMQEVFYETIREAKERGAAILLSSHNFAEAERVCDRVAIIRGGKLVADVSVAELQRSHKPSWRVTVDTEAAAKQLAHSSELVVESHHDRILVVRPKNGISAALSALSKVPVVAMAQQADELEDEFMTFYKGDKS